MTIDTTHAKPTTYAGVRMRSRLEAAYAEFVESIGGTWTYEPDCFADHTGQYLPDFWVARDDSNGWFIEIKPESILRDREALPKALTRMEIIWSSVPHADITLVVGHDIPDGWPIHKRFWTSFSARGAADRLWRIQSTLIRIPMVWERPSPKDTGS
jgi:hypothetical protein